MRPTLRQMEYFLAVADLNGFGPAAERLHVTQPSLSKQIAVLEAELGVSLFHRTSRSVRLTPHGNLLVPLARKALSAARSFREEARRLSGEKNGRMRAGVLPSIGAYFMPRFRESVQSELKDFRVSLVEGPSGELLNQLGAGKLDFVVASRSDHAGVDALPVFDETLWFCAAPDDPLMSTGKPAALSELSGRELLTLSPDFYLTRITQELAVEAGAKLSSEYHGPSLDAIRQMAVNGDGVAILPSLYALGEAVRDPEFRIRLLDHPKAIHPVFLYWRTAVSDQAFYQRLGEEMISEHKRILSERADRFRT